jgi:hypothetical protein
LKGESTLQNCLGTFTGRFVCPITVNQFAQLAGHKRAGASPALRCNSPRFFEETGLDCHGNVVLDRHT